MYTLKLDKFFRKNIYFIGSNRNLESVYDVITFESC